MSFIYNGTTIIDETMDETGRFEVDKDYYNKGDDMYDRLRMNPPVLEVKKDATKVIFTMVSCMCDNISYVKIENNVVSHYNDHCALSFSNLQCHGNKEDVIWAAEDEDWTEVIRILNSGTSKIASVRSK